MLALLTIFSIAAEGGRDPLLLSLCICGNTCPESCSEKESIIVSQGTNITKEIEEKSSTFLNIFTSIDLTGDNAILMEVFNGSDVAFNNIKSDAPAKVELKWEAPIFDNTVLVFYGVEATLTSQSQSELSLKGLKTKGGSVAFTNVRTAVTVNWLNASLPDIEGLKKITFAGTGSYAKVKMASNGNLIFESDTSVNFGSLTLAMTESTPLSLDCNGHELVISAQRQLTSTIETVINGSSKLTIAGDWPSDPNAARVTGLFESANISYSVLGNIPFPVLVKATGDIVLNLWTASSINFVKDFVVAGRFEIDSSVEGDARADITFKTLTIGSLWMETEAIHVSVETLTRYTEGDDLPVVYSVGMHGISTLEVTKEIKNVTMTPYRNIYCHLNFAEFKNDNQLDRLLSRSWTVFSTSRDVYVDDFAYIRFVDDFVIHGFSNFSSNTCLASNVVVGDKNLDIVVNKSMPIGSIDRILCYKSSHRTCRYVEAIAIEDEAKLANLGTDLILDGMKQVSMYIGEQTDKIDLSNLGSQKDIDITITYGGNVNAIVKFGDSNSHINSVTFESAVFATAQSLKVPVVSFVKSNVASGGSLTFGSNTKVITDQPSLANGIFGSTKVNELNVNLVADAKITMQADSWDIAETVVPYTNIANLIFYTDKKVEIGFSGSSGTGFTVITTGDTAVTFAGDYRNVAIPAPGINIIHERNDLKIINQYPFMHENVHITGSGSLHYVDDFKTEIKLCACVGDTCAEACTGRTQVAFNELYNGIKGATETVVDVLVIGTTDTEKPSLDLDCFTNKTVKIVGSGSKQHLAIIEKTPLQSVIFSAVELTNFMLEVSAEDSVINFGALTVNDCTLKEVSKYHLECTDLTASYEFMSFWAKITILDNLYGHGIIAHGVNVDFHALGDEIQLMDLEIQDMDAPVLVTVGNDLIHFGLEGNHDYMVFNVSVDGVRQVITKISPEANQRLEFTCSSEFTADKDHSIEVRATDGSEIIFSGNWPGPFPSGHQIFNVTTGGSEASTIILKNEHLPVCIWNVEQYTLVADAQVVSVSGVIRAYQHGIHVGCTEDAVANGRVSFEMSGGFEIEQLTINDPTLIFDNSQIDLTIEWAKNVRETLNYEIIFCYFCDFNGISSVHINHMGYRTYYRTDKIYMMSSMTGVHKDDELILFTSASHTLLTAPRTSFGDIETMQSKVVFFDSRDPMEATHGFKNGAVALVASYKYLKDLSGTHFVLSVTCPQAPSMVPMKICGLVAHSNENDCEINLTADQMSSLSTYIPSFVKNVEINVSYEKTVMSFAGLEGLNVTITGESSVRPAIELNDGNGFAVLDLNHVEILHTSTLNTGTLDLLNISDVNWDGDQIKLKARVCWSDFVSWNAVHATEFWGDLYLMGADHIVFREGEVAATDSDSTNAIEVTLSYQFFDTINFISRKTMQFVLDDATTSIGVSVVNFYDKECELTFSGDWTKPGLNLNHLQVSSPYQSHIVVGTDSYWYPQIFQPTTTVTYKLISSAGPLALPDRLCIDHENIYKYDVSVLTDKRVIGKSLVFQGMGEFSVINSEKPTSFETVEVNDGAKGKVSAIDVTKEVVLKNMAEMNMNLNSAPVVRLHWADNKFPLIQVTEAFKPTTLSIEFIGEGYNNETLNKLLYHRCYVLIDFGGDNDKCKAFQSSTAVKFVSTVPQFNDGDDLVFITSCDVGYFYLTAHKSIIAPPPAPTNTPRPDPTPKPTSKPIPPTRSPVPTYPRTPSASRSPLPVDPTTALPVPTEAAAHSASVDGGVTFAVIMSLIALVFAGIIIFFKGWKKHQEGMGSGAMLEKKGKGDYMSYISDII